MGVPHHDQIVVLEQHSGLPELLADEPRIGSTVGMPCEAVEELPAPCGSERIHERRERATAEERTGRGVSHGTIRGVPV